MNLERANTQIGFTETMATWRMLPAETRGAVPLALALPSECHKL